MPFYLREEREISGLSSLDCLPKRVVVISGDLTSRRRRLRVYTCCVLASILCAGCAHNDSGVSARRGIGYVLLGIAVADVLTESGAAIYHEAKGIEYNGELIGVRLGVSAAIGLAGAILISTSQNEKETVKPIQALGSKSFGKTCRAGSECKSRLIPLRRNL